ncbi:MAG: hypothetical protein KA271_01055 [Propionivibrio sp.]|jgi:hypothetical protein|nr:hypothetical protein [Propionivibrio sp.]
MTKKQKLELTWIGKANRPRLERRILMDDPAKSYHAKRRIASADFRLSVRWLIQRVVAPLRSPCQSTSYTRDHFAGTGKMMRRGTSGVLEMDYHRTRCCHPNASPGIASRVWSHLVIQSIV